MFVPPPVVISPVEVQAQFGDCAECGRAEVAGLGPCRVLWVPRTPCALKRSFARASVRLPVSLGGTHRHTGTAAFLFLQTPSLLGQRGVGLVRLYRPLLIESQGVGTEDLGGVFYCGRCWLGGPGHLTGGLDLSSIMRFTAIVQRLNPVEFQGFSFGFNDLYPRYPCESCEA